MTSTKRIAKRTAALLLCVVLLTAPVAHLFIPKAQADVMPGVLPEPAIRQMMQIASEYAKIGALEAKIALGGLSAGALAKGQAILASLKTAVAATGVTPAMAAKFAGPLALAGVIVCSQDWSAYWNAIFNRADFLTTYQYVGNPIGNWIVNYTHLDDFATWIVNTMGIPQAAGVDPWDWSYVEVARSGWATINDFFGNLFGRTSGTQTLPALSPFEALDMMNAVNMGVLVNRPGQLLDRYILPENVRYFSDSYGQSIGFEWFLSIHYQLIVRVHSRWYDNYSAILNGETKSIIPPGYDTFGSPGAHIAMLVQICRNGKMSDRFPQGYDVSVGIAEIVNGQIRISHGFPIITKRTELGLPAVPFDNRIPEIGGAIPLLPGGDTVGVQFPAIPATGNPYIDFDEWMKRLREWNPTQTGTQTGVCIGTATCECAICKEKAGTDTDVQVPGLPPALQNVRLPPGIIDKFPFSIPFTIIAVFTVLNAKSEAPVFVIPFAIPMFNIYEEITIDLSMFEPVIEILRWFLTLLYIFSLALITRAVIKG